MSKKDKQIRAMAQMFMEDMGYIPMDWVKNNGLENYVIPAA